MFTKIILLLVVTNFNLIFCANILYIVVISSPSHHIWNKVLASQLGKNGHNVTYISADKENEIVKNVHFLQFEGVYEGLLENFNANDMADLSPYETIDSSIKWRGYQCHLYLKSKGLKFILNYPKNFKFDLIIMDQTSGPCLLPIIHNLNYPPTIIVTPFLLPSYMSYPFDKSLINSLYIPWYGLKYGSQMNFLERVTSYVYTHLELGSRWLFETPKVEEMIQEVFGRDVPPLEVLHKHVSLLLANTDPILDHAQSLPPNVISVGGLHTGRTNQKIPDDLLKLLDSAKDGVVLFSLGTNIRSNELTPEVRKALLEAFSEISQLVIWKFESELEGLPKNVIVRKWLPQDAILAHPNVKLFIGHGGALSTQEAIYQGVPMIAVPFFIDQNTNAQLIVERRLGVKVDFRLITTNYMLEKLREVLNNPIYTENMKRRSKQFRDKPQTPLQKATFWVEFVLRNGDAKLFDPITREMNYIHSSGLDVIGFLFLMVFCSLFSCVKLLMLVISFRKSKEKIKKA